MSKLPEAWLRGPIAGVPPLLQPVAHCLLACNEEVQATLATISIEKLWARPTNLASVGYHVRHAAGSLDRLFTYARGEALSKAQLAVLMAEAGQDPRPAMSAELAAEFNQAIEQALAQLRETREADLLLPREVGRAKLPSTVLGLLYHAAEHTQRHVGQMKTTAKMG
jgi:uncharacterized damage-inducible protein DinB